MRSVELSPKMPNTINNNNMLAAEIGIDHLGLSKPSFSPLFFLYTFPPLSFGGQKAGDISPDNRRIKTG